MTPSKVTKGSRRILQRSGRGCSPPVTELHGKGGLHAENSVPGWHEGLPRFIGYPGGLRSGRPSAVGFHRQVGRPGTQTKSQPHPLPWRPGTEPSLARARHASETRERRQVELQYRSPHTRRAPCRNDLGSTAKACFQHRHRGLQFLWRICQGHRMYRGPGRHRSNTDSPAPERTGNTDSAIAGATDQSATWDVASFRWEGFQHNSTTPARKPVNTAWHELSRATVQE